MKAKTGRPSKYTAELADKLCSLLSEGKSMRTACKDEELPDTSTVFRWLRTNDEFRKQYEIAKEESVEAWAEESMDIADDGTNDWMESNNPDNPGYRANGENIQRSRLRIDTRKWYASKLKPKKYGDRIFQETKHSGMIGMKDVTNMSDEELERELRSE